MDNDTQAQNPQPPPPEEQQGHRRGGKREGVVDQAEQPVPKKPLPEFSPMEYVEQIIDAIQSIFGQSVTELGEMFVRNEVPLQNTVETLRQDLATHRGQLGNLLELLRTALGPSRMGPTTTQPPLSTSASTVSTDPPPEVLPFTDASARNLLRSIGRVFQLTSNLVKKLGYGETNVLFASTEYDNNRIAHAIGFVYGQVGDMLQFTHRSKLRNIVKNVNNQVPVFKKRIDTTIEKTKEMKAAVSSSGLNNCPILQVVPAVFYPATGESDIRYNIAISRDDFDIQPPRIDEDPSKQRTGVVPEQVINRREENLLIRYGSTELINGCRSTSINYEAHGLKFSLHQIYLTHGWVEPKGPAMGQCVRALEFNLSGFEKGSVGHHTKAKSRDDSTSNSALEGQTQNIQITVSGIVQKQGSVGFSGAGRRIEFVFILPSNLTIKHLNDVGIRDSVLKIQFAK